MIIGYCDLYCLGQFPGCGIFLPQTQSYPTLIGKSAELWILRAFLPSQLEFHAEELGDGRSNPFLKCHRLPLFLSFSIQMISSCCIPFGQFPVPKWLLVIIQHDFCQGFLGRGFPNFSFCNFGSWSTYIFNFELETLTNSLRYKT